MKELEEIGLPSAPDLETTVEDMVRKGYIGIDKNEKLYGKKPTLSMARLLDHTFPKMPGMNLVACLIQTLEEVNSGRKDTAFAIKQFDETLKMRGVQLKKEKRAAPHPIEKHDGAEKSDLKTAPPDIRDSHADLVFDTATKDLKDDDIHNRRKSFSLESKVISSNGSSNPLQIKEIKFGLSNQCKSQLTPSSVSAKTRCVKETIDKC